MEAQFGVIEGVIRTRVGYAGGQMADPDYSHLGDHTETVQIDFDPQRISYKALLDIFWKSHSPQSRSYNRQYMNAIFYHNEQQRLLGLETLAAIEKITGRTVRTPVLPVRAFYRAEDYHQKYYLGRRSNLSKALAMIYPEIDAFVDSTAVARINGYVGGFGSSAQLAREASLLGLSPKNQAALMDRVRAYE